MRFVLSTAICSFLSAALFAQTNSKDTLTGDIPQIQLVSYKDKLLGKVPGSIAVVNATQINKIAPLTGNDVLRKVPGLNIVDEEGAGLRINIGIRGLDPDRSRNILLLEDGVPVALNPYGEPEMYFTPVIDKVKTVEVLKGSGQILFGPQTIGGAVNFITAAPPPKASTELKINGGQNGFFSAYASYGNTVGNTGFIVSYLHKRAANMGPTWFNLNDLSAKLHIRLNSHSGIGIKAGVYDELSNSTYVGITQTMYDKGGQDFTILTPDDRLPVRRYNISATYHNNINDKLKLKTTAFAYTTTRNWRRQDFSFNPSAPNRTGVVWGDQSVANGALYMLNSNGHRNRQFEVAGIEPQIKLISTTGNIEHQTQIGVRLLWEKANEQFIVGRKANATAGDLRDDEIRSGLATSAYIQDKMQLSKKWSAHAGIRMEQFNYQRQINRGRFVINNATVTADTLVSANNTVFALIPGVGINFQVNENTTVFAGVHKGFAPPRTKDAITTTGFAIDIEEEQSLNYELGIRANKDDIWWFEATAFMMQFSNQIIPISQSSGNQNAIGIANGGATLHQGVEMATSVDILKWLKQPHSLTVDANITWVQSKFDDNRFIQKNGNLININGNNLTYAPEWICNTNISFVAKKGWSIALFGNYTDNQFTDELNSIEPTANGLTGKISSRFIVDATAILPLKQQKINLSISAKNITNERFIVSRRPQGIKVGLPSFVTAGLSIKL